MESNYKNISEENSVNSKKNKVKQSGNPMFNKQGKLI